MNKYINHTINEDNVKATLNKWVALQKIIKEEITLSSISKPYNKNEYTLF